MVSSTATAIVPMSGTLGRTYGWDSASAWGSAFDGPLLAAPELPPELLLPQPLRATAPPASSAIAPYALDLLMKRALLARVGPANKHGRCAPETCNAARAYAARLWQHGKNPRWLRSLVARRS